MANRNEAVEGDSPDGEKGVEAASVKSLPLVQLLDRLQKEAKKNPLLAAVYGVLLLGLVVRAVTLPFSWEWAFFGMVGGFCLTALWLSLSTMSPPLGRRMPKGSRVKSSVEAKVILWLSITFLGYIYFACGVRVWTAVVPTTPRSAIAQSDAEGLDTSPEEPVEREAPEQRPPPVTEPPAMRPTTRRLVTPPKDPPPNKEVPKTQLEKPAPVLLADVEVRRPSGGRSSDNFTINQPPDGYVRIVWRINGTTQASRISFTLRQDVRGFWDRDVKKGIKNGSVTPFYGNNNNIFISDVSGTTNKFRVQVYAYK